MASYFRKGAFVEDPWASRPVVAGADWAETRTGTVPTPIGLHLEPGFKAETLADDLDRIALIKIAFPKFTDGRGYSMAFLLRGRLGYKGELRAVGDVLFDEMQLMARCGFDAFEILDEPTIKLLQEGRRAATFDRFYQPGLEAEVPAGTRPWARRPASSQTGNLA